MAFDGQYVTITRKGILGRLSVGKGEKRFHISQISSVQWKPAGPLVQRLHRLLRRRRQRTPLPVRQPDLERRQRRELGDLHHQAENRVRRTPQGDRSRHRQPPQRQPERGTPPRLSPTNSPNSPPSDEGAITDAEFQQQKQRLLGG
ncbi:DUF4429 domain-containing protein [Kitasatospora aureofaciens]